MADKAPQPVPPDAKRRKVESNDESCSPTSIVTWNCNGFKHRCLHNQTEMEQLLTKTHHPDLIAVQEAKLKQASETRPSTPCAEDLRDVKPALNQVFGMYTPIWSLASTRHSGTLTLVHKRLNFDPSNKVAFSCQAAIDMLLRQFQLTKTQVGLPAASSKESNNNNKGHKPKPKQTSMTAFFSTKTKSSSTAALVGKHHPEGRFQFLFFPDTCFLQVYTPNNGHKVENNQRRADWDKDIQFFLKARQTILEHAKVPHRPLVWCGDLNCALTYHDGTHWERLADGTIAEWWTDENKSLSSSVQRDPDRPPHDIGTASFTRNERKRLQDTIQQADLVDVWRQLHPTKDDTAATPTKDYWTQPLWTWRGHLSQQPASFSSKYEGKGQRIDFFLLSPSATAMETVDHCQILGHGTERHGFCGSDHCPMWLRLKPDCGSGVTTKEEEQPKTKTRTENDRDN